MPKSYEDKRDFEKTPEPAGATNAGNTGPLRFVIQKHAARRLHYDLRLEMNGALASWAVPKGPSLNPKDKHLAVHVEDHPLSYASFEGQIPKGEYGGGQVIVWDEGEYSPDEDGKLSFDNRKEAEQRMLDGLAKGKLSFTLRGSKLAGSWTLVKTKRKDDEWLLIKHQDEAASDTRKVLDEERSVISGRTVEDVAAGLKAAHVELDLSAIPGAVKAKTPRKLSPTLATEASKPFDNPEWTFEVKLDGIRAVAIVENRQVKLLSRNANDITAKFPALARELASFPHENFVVDGEIVLYDDKGIPSFQSLLERFQKTNPLDIARADQFSPIEYCLFDVMHLDGWDLRGASLSERRQILDEAGFRGASTRVIDSFPEHGKLVYEQATGLGFEGVMGKKLSSKYKDGVRSADWVKVKSYHSEDFVVVGYTAGAGMRGSTFGALVLGAYTPKLSYQGNVGGGFSDQQLEEIRALLEPLAVSSNPFEEPVSIEGKVQWVEPKIWVEVQFANRTREGRLRFPIFKRLRPDLTVSDKEAPKNTNPPDLETDAVFGMRDAARAALQAGTKQEHESNTSQPTTFDTESSRATIDSVLLQLKQNKQDLILDVDGAPIRITSLDKTLWPAHGDSPAVTKRDLAIYYASVAPFILPHLRNRPLAFVRCPNGIDGEHFFQKHWEKGVPEFVEETPIWSSTNNRAGKYILCNNLQTLLWLAQLGTLEIHPWYSRVHEEATRQQDGSDLPADTATSEEALDASVLNYPDFMVIDLDPNIRSGKEKEGQEPELNKDAFQMTVDVAFALKQMLDDLNITGFLKTSGKTGLHVYIPIERTLPYEIVRQLCETIGRHLMSMMPDRVTMEWVVKKRPEKIFFDHNQNVRGKTLVSIYSPRPVVGAPVSFPVEWKNLERTYPLDYTIHTAPELLTQTGDLWADFLRHKHDLHQLLQGA